MLCTVCCVRCIMYYVLCVCGKIKIAYVGSPVPYGNVPLPYSVSYQYDIFSTTKFYIVNKASSL